jgi:hypothetical protein
LPLAHFAVEVKLYYSAYVNLDLGQETRFSEMAVCDTVQLRGVAMRYRVQLVAITTMVVLLSSGVVSAVEDEPLSRTIPALSGFSRKLEPDKLLTSGGLAVKSGPALTVEPEVGVSHTTHQRELGSGYEDITHKLHAQAGGKLRLSDMFYLGFATKLPIYNYGTTEGRTPGGAATPATPGRHEILRLSPNNLTWTGELGLRLGRQIDLNLYYDQNVLKGPLQPGTKSDEEVIGTRFILRFK